MPKRLYIPYPERLAAALADRLPEDVRNDLRRRKVPAKAIEALFQIDHNITVKTDDGPDQKCWYNLNIMTPEVHLEKTKRDAKVHAKARSLELKRTGPSKPKPRWPKGQKIAKHVDPWGKKFRAKMKG